MSAAADPAVRGCRRVADAALIAGALVAIASLPAAAMPWPWLLALLLPGAVLGLWPAAPRPLWRACAGVALQLWLCVLANDHSGALARPAALAGTILPPLAFVTVRRHNGDAQLGLFLGFCVLLVGAILGERSSLLLVAYVVAAVVQLRCACRLAALQRQNRRTALAPAAAPARQLLAALPLSIACLLAALLVERTLAFLPAPVRDDAGSAAAAAARPHVGLGDAFDLGGDGNPLDLRGERLVSVAMADGSAVPDDLYLRSGFYQLPGLDSWQVGALAPQRGDGSGEHRLRMPTEGVPVRRLQIALLPDARNRVFVPVGVCVVVATPAMLGDPLREWVRPEDDRVDGYAVDYQDQPAPADELPIDPRWDRAGLLELPADLDAALLQPLLDEFRPAGTAWAKATAIARGLQARCRYALREPGGPHGHALLNFLHGDRTGFCMHFASATALLLRRSGVACRVGVGLYGGKPGAHGQREYGAQHAHAWVELPVLGRGWVRFDPTPPAQRGARPAADAAAEAPPDDLEKDRATDPAANLRATLRSVLAAPWPYALLLAAFLLPLRRRRAQRAGAPVPAPQRPARRWLARILRGLATRGHPRPPGITLEQFAAALARAARCPVALPPAFTAYQEVRFGGRPFDAAREQRMAAALAAVRELPAPAPGHTFSATMSTIGGVAR